MLVTAFRRSRFQFDYVCCERALGSWQSCCDRWPTAASWAGWASKLSVRCWADNAPKEQLEFPFWLDAAQPKCLLELSIDRFTGAVRSKAGWQAKLQDANITSRWEAEAIKLGVRPADLSFGLQACFRAQSL